MPELSKRTAKSFTTYLENEVIFELRSRQMPGESVHDVIRRVLHGFCGLPIPPRRQGRGPHTTVSSQVAYEIQKQFQDGKTQRDIAKTFGVSATQVHRIIRKGDAAH